MATQVQNEPKTKTKSTQSAKVKSYVDRQLQKTRRQVKMVDLMSALIGLVVLVLIFFLLAAIVDAWVWPLTGTARWIGLLSLVGLILGFSAAFVFPLLFRKINPEYAAKMIEDSTPSTFKNSLLNYLRLGKKPEEVKRGVLDAVGRQAATNLSNTPPESTVDRSKLIRAGLLLAGITVAVIGYSILSPKNPMQTVKRLLWPASKISKPAVVQILNVEPGDASVFFGDELEVRARIRGKHNPGDVRILISTDDGQITNFPIEMRGDEANQYTGTITTGTSGIQQPLRYQIVARDGVSPEFNVKVLANPSITVERIEIQPPKYTEIPNRTITGRGDIEAFEGSIAMIHAVANLPIKRAAIEFLQVNEGSDQPYTSVGQPHEMVVDGKNASAQIELGLNEARTKQRFSHYRIAFTSVDGDPNKNANVYTVRITPDLAPEIAIVDPKSPASTPANRKMAIDIEANDLDYKISKIEIRLSSNGNSLVPESSELALRKTEAGQFVTTRYYFDPNWFGLKDGDTVLFKAMATDNRVHQGRAAGNQTLSDELKILITPADEGEDPNKNKKNPKPGEQPESPENDNEPEESETGDSKKEKPGENGSDETDGDNPESNSENSTGEGENDSESGNEEGETGESGTEDGSEPKQGENAGEKPGEESGDSGNEDPNGGTDEPNNDGNDPNADSGSDPNGQGEDPADDPSNDPNGDGGEPNGDGGDPNDGSSDPSGGDPGSEEMGDSGSNPEDADNGANGNSKGNGTGESGTDDESVGNNNTGEGQASEDPSGNSNEEQSGDNTNGTASDGTADGDARRDGELMDGEKQPLGEDASEGDQFERAKEYFENQEQQQNGQPSEDPSDPSNDPSQGDPSENATGEPQQQSPREKDPNGQSKNPGEKDPSGQPGENSGEPSENSGEPGENTGEKNPNTQPSDGSNEKDPNARPGDGTEQNDPSNEPKDGSSSDKPSEKDPNKQGSPSEKPGDPGDSDPNGEGNPNGEGESDPADSDPKDNPGQNENSKPGEPGESGSEDPGAESKPGENGGESGPSGSKPGEGGESKSQNQGSSSSSSSQSSGDKTSDNEGDQHGATGQGAGQGDATAGDNKEALEHAKKQTDLVLEKLKDQQHNPDPELLRQMGKTKEELQAMIKRWDEMKKAAQKGDIKSKRKYEDALQSLGIRPASDKRTLRGKRDQLHGLGEDSAVNRPPAEDREEFNSFLLRRNRTKKNRKR